MDFSGGCFTDRKLAYRVHAVKLMFQRGVSDSDIRNVLITGEVIEDYPGDNPYPSRLILGFAGDRPIHVVTAENKEENETIIITVYEPDPALWSADFRRRKSK